VILPGPGVPGAASVQPALRGAPLLAWVEGGGRITLPPPPPLASLLARHASTAATAPGRTGGGARLRDVRPGTGAASPALADGRGGRPKRLTGDPVSEAEGGEELNGSGAWDLTG
jgi:hypothetical protein